MPGYLGKAIICFGHKKNKHNPELTTSPQNHPIRPNKIDTQTMKMDPPPQQGRDKICPGNDGDITIL
jgi:hypothetical protein